MNPAQTLILILLWVVPAAVAMLIGKRKGRTGIGFLLGVLLGWIGVVIIAVIRPTHEMLVHRERERLQIQREARGS